MARLRRRNLLRDEDSESSDFSPLDEETTSRNTTTELRSSPRKITAKSYCDTECDSSEESEHAPKSVPKAKTNTQPRSKQIRLAPLSSRFLSKPLPNGHFPRMNPCKPKTYSVDKTSKDISSTKQRSIKTVAQPNTLSSDYDITELGMEGSIWNGSNSGIDDSDEELPSPRKFVRIPKKASETEQKPETQGVLGRAEAMPLNEQREPPNPIDKVLRLSSVAKISSRPTSSSDKENGAAFLQYSPPRLYSPSKQSLRDRPVTPPQSPSKSRLQSPSKPKSRLPTPPLRQSLDAFWHSNTVNEWNDQYSPQKILKSPRKLQSLKDDALESPTASPRKCQSPSKSTRLEREAKKDFECRKPNIAEEFLAELDSVVTRGEIQKLAATTGGVRFVWSKTLNSTAGRANWRKETTKTQMLNGTVEITYKHHASIELAEKVIDDEDRLLNVIAHEFCHLANFMISGIKDQPHGRQFKEWGRKCTQAFKHRGVEVTTKHSYKIEYKYIWQCSNEDCAVEFKRHSKSIDPKRHTCGTCRSKLIQIKPVPRKDAGNATGYAAYVKANFAEVKRGMAGASQKEVMEAIGRKYRANKVDGQGTLLEKKTVADVNELVNGLEVITLDDD